MPQLFGYLLLLCAYIALISFLFQTVAPLLMIGLSLVVSVTISWLCAKTFSRTYSPDNPSKIGEIAVLGMLLLLCGDFIVLINHFVAISMQGFPPLEGQLPWLLPSTWLIPILAAPFGLQPFGLASIVLAIVVKGLMLPMILLFFRGLRCEDRHTSEPAFLSYFQKAAFRDLGKAVKSCSLEIPGHIKPIATWITKSAFGGRQAWVLWPLGLTALISLLVPVLFAAFFLGSILVIYGVSLFLLQVFNQFLSKLLYWAETLVMKIRAGYAKCPHAECYKPLPLPILVCPACSAEHRRLLPGRTGVFYRRCECGESLPTLFLLGKGGLPSRCNHCKQDLPDQVFGANIHLPIYGGPDAGKTSFMAAGVAHLVQGKVSGVLTHWLRDRDRIDFEQKWQNILSGGPGPRKTMEHFPNAYLVSLQRQNGLAASLYLYDPAGETFGSAEKLDRLSYMTYSSGILFIVDPLALPEVAEKIERESPGSGLSRASSQLPAREVFDRLVQQLEGLHVFERRSTLDVPVAVIIAKSDLAPLCRELGAGSNAEIARSAGEKESDQARDWLQRVEPALVHGIETRFRNVRYFAVAALPANPGAKLSRESVLAPLCWLFSWQQVLAKPELTRWKWALLEVGAFAAVAVLAFTPPVGLLFYLLGLI